MSYTVRIRKNDTGEIRKRKINLPWQQYSMFWWIDGNFGCDCNREAEFLRAGDEEVDWDKVECGSSKYSVLDATLEDGTLIKIDVCADFVNL